MRFVCSHHYHNRKHSFLSPWRVYDLPEWLELEIRQQPSKFCIVVPGKSQQCSLPRQRMRCSRLVPKLSAGEFDLLKPGLIPCARIPSYPLCEWQLFFHIKNICWLFQLCWADLTKLARILVMSWVMSPVCVSFPVVLFGLWSVDPLEGGSSEDSLAVGLSKILTRTRGDLLPSRTPGTNLGPPTGLVYCLNAVDIINCMGHGLKLCVRV